MIRVTREAIYRFRKGGAEGVCEVVTSPLGRFVVLHSLLRGRYKLKDKEEDWDLLEHQSFRDVKDIVVEYEDLPLDVRRALSRVT